MEFLRKYGVATTVYVPLIKAGSNDQALAADFTHATGDTTISKDGATAANITTAPSAITMGNGATWKVPMSATEMQGAQIVINISDAAPKAIEDQQIIIATYGNASAEHAVDLDDSVRAGLTALPNAAADAAGGLPISDAGGLDMDAILADTADMQPKIGTLTDLGSGATVADNLADIAGTTFSSSTDSLEALQAEHDVTQSLLEGFSATGSATNVPPTLSPGGFTLTTGSEVNTEDATRALDGTRHELTDSAGTTDGYYIFDIGAFGLPTSVTFKSVVNGGNDTFGIYVNVGSSGTPSWTQRGSITGTGTTTNVNYTFDLLETDVLTDDSTAVWIRVYGTGLTTSSFDTDQLYVSRTFSPQYSGYDNGQLWGDTTDGTAGTTPGFNGIASRPTDSLADAITLASAVGLDRFHWSSDSTITFAESHTDEVWASDGGTIALGGQDCSSSTFIGWNSVSGIATMASGEAHFIECEVDNATVGNSHFKRTGFGGTLTLNAATDYFFVDCYSQVAGASAPIIDMGAAVGATNVSIRRWSGGITLNNLAAGDVVTLDGIFGTITLNGADATVEIRGIKKSLVNNLTGSPTVSDDALTVGIQEDWTDGGRLDLILDELTTQGDTNETKLDTVSTAVVTTIPGLIDDIGIKKNTDFSNFEFLMVLTSDHVTPATGLTVTGQRSIDGGAFAAVSGTISEVSNGIYQFDALAADTNGDVITWRFSSVTADDAFYTFKTVA